MCNSLDNYVKNSTKPIVIGLVLVAIATLCGHQAFTNDMPSGGGIAGPSGGLTYNF